MNVNVRNRTSPRLVLRCAAHVEGKASAARPSGQLARTTPSGDGERPSARPFVFLPLNTLRRRLVVPANLLNASQQPPLPT